SGTVDVTARPRGGPTYTVHALPIDVTELSSVEVVGTGLAVGTEGRLQALGHAADGATVDITGLVGWSSSDPTVVTVSSRVRPGRIRALRAGSAVVSAALQGVAGTTNLQVSRQAGTALRGAAPAPLPAPSSP